MSSLGSVDRPLQILSGPLFAPKTSPGQQMKAESSGRALRVLIADDNPVNATLVSKLLKKEGHSPEAVTNGAAALERYLLGGLDVILMDLQMPIVDGFSSTKMIRAVEKTQGPACLSSRASKNGRIPIFAVSASLLEKEKDKYIATGFDGWILKPVDFKRVDELLKGIVNDETRNCCLYKQGQWEQGGWFEKRKEKDQFEADTKPSNQAPTVEAAKNKEEAQHEKGFGKTCCCIASAIRF